MDKSYIEKRVNEWIMKVEQIYAFVRKALQNEPEIECKIDNSTMMYEGVMKKYEVPPKNIPIFDLYIGKQLVATFKPIGLWVIGAKGRIDILTKKGAYLLVDMSEDETTPQWKVFAPTNRKNSELFNEEFIRKLVH